MADNNAATTQSTPDTFIDDINAQEKELTNISSAAEFAAQYKKLLTKLIEEDNKLSQQINNAFTQEQKLDEKFNETFKQAQQLANSLHTELPPELNELPEATTAPEESDQAVDEDLAPEQTNKDFSGENSTVSGMKNRQAWKETEERIKQAFNLSMGVEYSKKQTQKYKDAIELKNKSLAQRLTRIEKKQQQLNQLNQFIKNNQEKSPSEIIKSPNDKDNKEDKTFAEQYKSLTDEKELLSQKIAELQEQQQDAATLEELAEIAKENGLDDLAAEIQSEQQQPKDLPEELTQAKLTNQKYFAQAEKEMQQRLRLSMLMAMRLNGGGASFTYRDFKNYLQSQKQQNQKIAQQLKAENVKLSTEDIKNFNPEEFIKNQVNQADQAFNFKAMLPKHFNLEQRLADLTKKALQNGKSPTSKEVTQQVTQQILNTAKKEFGMSSIMATLIKSPLKQVVKTVAESLQSEMLQQKRAAQKADNQQQNAANLAPNAPSPNNQIQPEPPLALSEEERQRQKSLAAKLQQEIKQRNELNQLKPSKLRAMRIERAIRSSIMQNPTLRREIITLCQQKGINNFSDLDVKNQMRIVRNVQRQINQVTQQALNQQNVDLSNPITMQNELQNNPAGLASANVAAAAGVNQAMNQENNADVRHDNREHNQNIAQEDLQEDNSHQRQIIKQEDLQEDNSHQDAIENSNKGITHEIEHEAEANALIKLTKMCSEKGLNLEKPTTENTIHLFKDLVKEVFEKNSEHTAEHSMQLTAS